MLYYSRIVFLKVFMLVKVGQKWNGISKSEDKNLLRNVRSREKSSSLIKTKKVLQNLYVMDKEIIKFGDIEIGKRKFHHYKNSIFRGCRC